MKFTPSMKAFIGQIVRNYDSAGFLKNGHMRVRKNIIINNVHFLLQKLLINHHHHFLSDTANLGLDYY